MPDDQQAHDLAAEFARRSGRAADSVASAPGRVNLIGEHLDYNGGRCLPIALPYACLAACGLRRDEQVSVWSRQSGTAWTGDLAATGSATGWAGYAAGVIWALREAGYAVPGLDMVLDSDVPLGAGLSSSAAVEGAVALAVTGALGLEDDADLRRTLVSACVRAENDVVGAPTGGMDQTVALFASAAHALLLDFADGGPREVPWRPEDFDCTLLVIDTRVRHALDDGSYGDRRAECAQAAQTLGLPALAAAHADAPASLDDELLRRRTRHVVTEQARVDQVVAVLERGDLRAVGPELTESHRSLRDDFEVSCAELDAVVEQALDRGALGARMTGGGFGGSAIALVPRERVAQVRSAVTATFADRGWRPPAFLDGTASAAAGRLA